MNSLEVIQRKQLQKFSLYTRVVHVIINILLHFYASDDLKITIIMISNLSLELV